MECAPLETEDLGKVGNQDAGLTGYRPVLLKSDLKNLLVCWEPHHTEGYVSRCCLKCTMPICDACVVKDAFGKQEATYRNRRRYVCLDCWSPERSIIRPSGSGSRIVPSYAQRVASREFCQCSVYNGWLCSKCKTGQNSDLTSKLDQCVTERCPNKPSKDHFGGRMCLWCDLPMPGRMSPGEARREYDSLHLRARAYSSCEPLAPVKEVDDPEAVRFQIRHPLRPVFLGRDDYRERLDSQRQFALKPTLSSAHSAAALPTKENKDMENHKRDSGLRRRMSLILPSFKTRRDGKGYGLRTSMVKWRSSSASLLVQRPSSVIEKQEESSAIVLYEGP